MNNHDETRNNEPTDCFPRTSEGQAGEPVPVAENLVEQQSPEAHAPADPAAYSSPAVGQPAEILPGDPMATATAYHGKRILPEDLRISWSWPHLIVFLFFGFASLMVVQLSFVFYVSANRNLSAKQVEQVF